MTTEQEMRERVEKYLDEDSTIKKKIGMGQEGIVWETTQGSGGSVVKVLERKITTIGK